MRCDLHCPPAASGLRGPLLALAVLAAVSLGVYVVSLLGGVLLAAIVAVYVTAVAGAVVWVRRYAWRPQPRIRVTLQDGRLGAELVAGERRALPAGRSAVPGVVLGADAGEKLEA